MKIIKSTLTLSDRFNFVKDVVENCEINGKYEPAVFTFSFKAMVLGYFTDADFKGMTHEEIENVVFSEQAESVVYPAPELKNILDELMRACREKIQLDREEWMVNYKAIAAPDGLSLLADAVTNFAKEFTDKIDARQILKEVVKEREVVKNDAEVPVSLSDKE